MNNVNLILTTQKYVREELFDVVASLLRTYEFYRRSAYIIQIPTKNQSIKIQQFFTNKCIKIGKKIEP